MSNDVQLAHRIAAGFLEQAALFAERVGPDDLVPAMEKALANLATEMLDGADEPAAGSPERQTILLACRIATATLAADTRTVN
jgi:hypothetical protein